MYRTIIAALVAFGFVVGAASAASAAPTQGEFLRVHPTCTKPWLTNGGTARETCQTTATHYATGTKRWPVLVTYVDGCHRATWRTEGYPVGPTKDEGIRDTCWEGGRYVTYMI